MRRREFIIAVGCGSLRPLSAFGQQSRLRVVGVLGFGSLARTRELFAPTQSHLASMGFVEDRNVMFEYRCADGQEARLGALAQEPVQRPVDVIAVFTGQSIAAAKAATRSIPIVFFTGFDPVASGFVESLSRPGGNATGVSVLNTEVLTKRLAILREMLPAAQSVGFLYSATSLVAGGDGIWKQLETTANGMKLELVPLGIRLPNEFGEAFDKARNAHLDAVLVSADAIMFANREALVREASRHNIAASYPTREFTMLGGLVSYGTDYPEAYRQVGEYVGRVLNGERPDRLPVQQVTKLQLAINLRSAEALGLTIPSSLLARTDEVFE